MATYEGQNGALILGGKLVEVPLVNGALSSGDTAMDIDGTTLTGVVAIGDVFTLSGETGSPSHTVTGGPFFVAAGNSITTLTFTAAVATGGVSNNATVAFTSNSAGEIRSWELTSELEMIDDTVKGDTARTFLGGLAQWRGSATAWLDYDDAQQASLIDELASGAPDGTVAALLLQVDSGKVWYGAGELTNFADESPEGAALTTVSFDFQGSGSILPNWV